MIDSTPASSFSLEEYDVGALIGVGQFGEVRRALSRRLGFEVALKRIPAAAADGANKIQAEQRGAELQRRLAARHKHLVPEVFEDGFAPSGDYYIAMEWIAGRSMADVLKAAPRPCDETARLGLAIADFLGKLHALAEGDNGEEPIVHSDLKPEHVLVLPDGSIRVLDLGIAKTLRANRALTVNFWASAPYASPERLDDGNVRLGDDLWAVGIMLFEMVSGQHPYQRYMVDDNNAALARAIRRSEPQDAIHAACDGNLAAVIRKMLAPQPAHRYASAEDAAADLRRYLDGEEPLAAAESARASTRTQVVPLPEGEIERRDTVPTEPLPAGASGEVALPGAVATPSRAGRRGPLGVAEALRQRALLRLPGVSLPRSLRQLSIPQRLRPFIALLVVAVFLAEASSCIRAERLRERLGSLEAADVERIRTDLRTIERGAPFGIGRARLHGAITDRMLLVADRPIHDFRQDLFVSQLQWEQAQRCLALAAEHASGDARVTAKAALVDAHLTRITAQARGIPPRERQRRLTAAMSRFIESARLDPSSPDPFLGQARINAYELHDYDALLVSISEAEKRGYRAGKRERMQLGDTLRFRADRAVEQAGRLPANGRRRLLEQASDDYEGCIQRFAGLTDYHEGEKVLAHCEARKGAVERMLSALEDPVDVEDADAAGDR